METKENLLLGEMKRSIDFLKKNGLLPHITELDTGHKPRVLINGKRYLLFTSNSYLGLNIHPKVISAAKSAIDKFSTGAGSSRLLGGSLSIHRELENRIALFKGTDDSLVFTAGFMVNIGVIPALTNIFTLDQGNGGLMKELIILSDELNHASIIEGCRLSRATIKKYKHCDIDDLNKILASLKRDSQKIIITDGVFSLDGDIAPLDKIVEISKKYSAILMVDDAHGTGVLGKKGRGISEYFNLHEEVDIMMGTFSKSLASTGGFIAGKHFLINYMRVAARSYVFSAAIVPSVAATVIAALEIIDEEPMLISKLLQNAKQLRIGLQNLGFNVPDNITPIIPIFIGDDRLCMELSYELFKLGIIAPTVRYPAVPKGTARIRITVSALYTDIIIDEFLEAIMVSSKKLKII